MQKTWTILEPDVELKNSLAKELGTSSLFAQLLISRGITDKAGADMFLKSDLLSLFDPFLMEGMKEAYERLKTAIQNKERVFVSTDFDVDGVTSCAILVSELRRLGVPLEYYLPHRQKDGYGLNQEAIALAKKFGAKVFIALDCGITSVEEAGLLKRAGIDCLIVDHHEPSQENLPAAFAILDPKKKTCPYPFKELASVGLVYKLIQAIDANAALKYLDLVALGTVADVVPLLSENRIFVRHGLDALNSAARPGIRSLVEAAGVKNKKVSTHTISFMLAPRLNASGRMDSAHDSLDLLLSEESARATELAQSLNDHNKKRQKTEEKVLNEALDLIEKEINFKDDFIIVLSQDDWHPGVLGIVASKIVDRFYRPAVIISVKDGVGRGSARSVHNFHIYEALVQCESFLKEFGGHKYAAGLSIEKKNIKEFKEFLNKIARAHFQQEFLSPVLAVDALIPLSFIDEELLRNIDCLSPHGEGNRRPVFVSRNLIVKSKPAIMGKNSLKFWVSDGEVTYEAIGFGMGEFFNMVSNSERVDLAYCLGWDEWGPHNVIQLEVKDIKISKS